MGSNRGYHSTVAAKRHPVVVASISSAVVLGALLIRGSLTGLTPGPPLPIQHLSAQSATPFLSIKRVTAATGPSGDWSIDWGLGTPSSGRVEVLPEGRNPQLLAVGGSGSVKVHWISNMSTYEFRLYSDGDPAPVVTTRLGPVRSWVSVLTAIGGAVALAVIAFVAWRAVLHALPALQDWRRVQLGLTAMWVMVAFVINPIGEFPINDDWAYAWSVKTLMDGGGFQLSDWAAVNLLPQVLWGSVFSLPGGFSFTALRISTLSAALIALLILHRLLRDTRIGGPLTVAGVLAVAFNPVYLALSNSFNNDVPAFALFVGAFYAIARGLAGSRVAMSVGIAVALVGILERQSNLVLLPALSAALLTMGRLTLRRVCLASLPALMGFACQMAYAQWLAESGRRPLLYGLQVEMLFETFRHGIRAVASVYAANLGVIAIYLGLFLFPMLALAYAEHLRGAAARQRRSSLARVAVVVVVGLALLGNRRMPLAGNVLERAGVGPPLTSDFYQPFAGDTVAAIHHVWAGLTIMGLAGAAIFGGALVRLLRSLATGSDDWHAKRPLVVFAVSTLALLFAGVGGLPPGAWFDRYLLPFVAVGAVLVALSIPHTLMRSPSRAQQLLGTAAIATLILFAAFGIVTTHDLMASTRARWVAYQDIIAKHQAAPDAIDAWDLSGWVYGQRIETCHANYSLVAGRRAGWSDFSCLDDHADRPYAVVYNPAGLTIVGDHSYQRWWPAMTDRLFTVRRGSLPNSDAH